MGSTITNGSVHTGNFYCDIDLNGEVVFDAVADALCEWTLLRVETLYNIFFA